jgi:tetratricopeptide (TPR) repeat protein
MKTNLNLFILICFAIIFSNVNLLAEGPGFDSLFQEGVKAYQEKKYDAAKTAFKKALELNPSNVSTLTNLALVHHQLGEKGWAIALLKKAQNINPDFSTSSAALDFTTPQLEVKEIPHDIRFIDNIHNAIFSKYPAWIFSLSAGLFFFLFFWQLIKYLGHRRKSQDLETARPNLSPILILNGLIALVLVVTMIFKILDQQVLRATVVEPKLSVLSLPDDKAPSLFEIFQGLEVIVNQTQGTWTQVTYPGGMTGWVPQNSIFITNGGQ